MRLLLLLLGVPRLPIGQLAVSPAPVAPFGPKLRRGGQLHRCSVAVAHPGPEAVQAVGVGLWAALPAPRPGRGGPGAVHSPRRAVGRFAVLIQAGKDNQANKEARKDGPCSQHRMPLQVYRKPKNLTASSTVNLLCVGLNAYDFPEIEGSPRFHGSVGCFER